jgi:transcription antitermination protein NusB
MALSQQKFREIVFQLLFSHDFSSTEEKEMYEFMMGQLLVTRKTIKEAQERKKEVEKRLGEIDDLIARFSASYDFQRIAKAEKNILRLGVYELCFSDSIPPKVAISEAIRLTRKYATFESAAFVNAVMDAIYQDRCKNGLCEEENGCLVSMSEE